MFLLCFINSTFGKGGAKSTFRKVEQNIVDSCNKIITKYWARGFVPQRQSLWTFPKVDLALPFLKVEYIFNYSTI
jgi:hypothetical protein